MKQGEGIPGLVGWEWHGEPAAIPGLGSRRQRPNPKRARKTERRRLYRDGLSRAEGKLRLQRLHLLVGRQPGRAAGLCAAIRVYNAQRSRRRAQRITANVLESHAQA